MDTNQPEVPEDELLSATGEGDEVMEEAEEQEGYSTCVTLFPLAQLYSPRIPSSLKPYIAFCHKQMTPPSSRVTSILNSNIFVDMD